LICAGCRWTPRPWVAERGNRCNTDCTSGCASASGFSSPWERPWCWPSWSICGRSSAGASRQPPGSLLILPSPLILSLQPPRVHLSAASVASQAFLGREGGIDHAYVAARTPTSPIAHNAPNDILQQSADREGRHRSGDARPTSRPPSMTPPPFLAHCCESQIRGIALKNGSGVLSNR